LAPPGKRFRTITIVFTTVSSENASVKDTRTNGPGVAALAGGPVAGQLVRELPNDVIDQVEPGHSSNIGLFNVSWS